MSCIVEWMEIFRDDTADKMGQGGYPLDAYGFTTFAINSPYFIAKNITFTVSLIVFRLIVTCCSFFLCKLLTYYLENYLSDSSLG